MIKKILFILCLFSVSLSCRKYLDVKPKSQIKENFLFANERGFVDALTGIYTTMSHRDLYGDKLTMSFLDVLAQRYKVLLSTSPYWDAYNYNYDSDNSKMPARTTIRSIWLSSYNCIANANNILENIDDRKNEFSQGMYDIVKGEALGLRAFIHLDLMRLFGPNMKKNPSALSIPYRIKLSREAEPRLPASEVMKKIIEDLKAAESLLKNDPLAGGSYTNFEAFDPQYRKYHLDIDGVKATMARAYQWMGEDELAYKYAREVIDAGHFTFVASADISDADACRDRTFRNEHIFTLQINNMQGYTDEYFVNLPTASYEDFALNNDDAVINQVFDNSSTDYRRQYLWESKSGKLRHSKFWQFSSIPDRCNWIKNIVPVIRISEMFYIAAETAPDLATGMDMLNTVLTHRGLDAVNNLTTKAELQDELTKEYKKEFFSEGQLFYYYKRLNFATIPGAPVPMSDMTYVLPVPLDESI